MSGGLRLIGAKLTRCYLLSQPNYLLTISFILSFIMLAKRCQAAFAVASPGKGYWYGGHRISS